MKNRIAATLAIIMLAGTMTACTQSEADLQTSANVSTES